MAQDIGEYQRLGTTADDSLGEAFDKVARLAKVGRHTSDRPAGPPPTTAGLSYDEVDGDEVVVGHYGAALEALALEGDAYRFKLPIPLQGKPGGGFSFSGLKTACMYLARREDMEQRQNAADLAAGFQRVAIAHICDRVRWALGQSQAAGVHHVVRSGVVRWYGGVWLASRF